MSHVNSAVAPANYYDNDQFHTFPDPFLSLNYSHVHDF